MKSGKEMFQALFLLGCKRKVEGLIAGYLTSATVLFSQTKKTLLRVISLLEFLCLPEKGTDAVESFHQLIDYFLFDRMQLMLSTQGPCKQLSRTHSL